MGGELTQTVKSANCTVILVSLSKVHDAERQKPFLTWVDPTLDLVLAPRLPLQRYVKTFYEKQKAIAKFFGHAANLNDENKPQYGGIKAVVVGFRFGKQASMLEAKFIVDDESIRNRVVSI